MQLTRACADDSASPTPTESGTSTFGEVSRDARSLPFVTSTSIMSFSTSSIGIDGYVNLADARPSSEALDLESDGGLLTEPGTLDSARGEGVWASRE